jgi:hypothetical protein
LPGYISSGINDPDYCNQFIGCIRNIKYYIIVYRYDSGIVALPGFSFIQSESLRVFSQRKDLFFNPIKLSDGILGRRRSKAMYSKMPRRSFSACSVSVTS